MMKMMRGMDDFFQMGFHTKSKKKNHIDDDDDEDDERNG
jgi:hypothetical protein